MPWRDAVREQRARTGDDMIYWGSGVETTDAGERSRINVD